MQASNRQNIKYQIKTYNDTKKPIIIDASWGKTFVSYLGEKEKYKDVILWDSGHKAWDWSISNTHHNPGIQILEVKELVEEYDCNFIILSTGFEDVLRVAPETIQWLDRNKIGYKIMNSMDAIKFYNSCDKEHVGLLLHSTC